MIRKLRIIWLQMLMNHSLNLEAAYSQSAAGFRNAVFGAILDGKDPSPWQSAAAVYHAMICVEQDLQREYRGRLIGLGVYPEMIEFNGRKS